MLARREYGAHRQKLCLAPCSGVEEVLERLEKACNDFGQSLPRTRYGGEHAQPLVMIWSSLPCPRYFCIPFVQSRAEYVSSASDPEYTFRKCHYDPNSINPISYRFFSVGSEYETAFKDAEKAWDATSAPGYFEEHSTSFDPEINVIDDRSIESAWAWAWAWAWACACAWASQNCPNFTEKGTSKLYEGNEVEIEFNLSTTNSMSAHQKKIIAMHELGHAYGLGHVSSGCRLMRLSDVIFTCGEMSTDDDVAGVTALYPDGDED